MNNANRKPIKSKMRRVVLLISVISLLAISIDGAASMLFIRSRSKQALTGQMEQELTVTAVDKADLANAKLEIYSEYVKTFAGYIHTLYEHPELVKDAEISPVSADNAGKLVMQPAKIREDIPEEDIAAERALLGNLQQILYPVLSQNEDVITSAYFATERGLTMAYDKQSDLKVDIPYFDAHDTNWYRLAKENDGPVFTDVYLDAFGRGLTITCVSPFYEADGSFAGAVAMDILILDLYRDTVAVDSSEEYTALLVDSQGSVISPDMEGKMLAEEEGIDDTVADGILSGGAGLFLSSQDVYYACAPVRSTGWKYCIRIPRSVVLEPVGEMDVAINMTIIIFAAVFILAIIAILIFSDRFAKSLTRPITALGNDAKEISSGNLDHKAAIVTNDEIGDLAMDFNVMAERLKDYIANLTRVTAEKERIGAELNVATQIQADMLPSIFPPFPDMNEFDIFASMDPAKEVGGDFYDFFLIDENHLCLVMADVSGKGVPAALFMVIAKTLIKNRAQMGGTPSEILAYVNDQLCDSNESQLFVTVWFAILDVKTGKGIAANAGHEHPVLKKHDGAYSLVVYRHSMVLAVMEGIPFRQHEFQLEPGDTLFVYTDGVPEATNAEEQLFGSERMLAALNREPDADLKTLLKNVREDIDGFVQDAPQFDDITMLALRYNGPQDDASAGFLTEEPAEEA